MSIRSRLLLSLSLAIGVITAIATTAGYFGSRHEADEVFDAQLAQYARTVGELLAHYERDETLRVRDFALGHNYGGYGGEHPGHGYEAKIAFRVVDGQGKVVAHSERFPAQDDIELRPGYRDIRWNGQDWRLFCIQHDDADRWIITAERGDIRGELAQEIAWQSIFPVLVGLPVTALLIAWLVPVGLRPLQRLSAEFQQREAAELSPIPTDRMPAELRSLTQSANDLLFRLAQSFQRERRFTANAAHELRTPIAALLVHLENALAERPGDLSLQKALTGARRMRHVVEQLLTLARTAPEHYLARFERIDLLPLAQEVAAELAPLALRKRQHLALEGEGPMWVEGDRTGLAVLLRNLMGNAIHYTPADGRIQVRLRRVPAGVELQVIDTGPGIPVGLRERVFDRFYRVGGDRREDGDEGAGLGLSIVRQLLDLHGATIELADPDGHTGLMATVCFPAAATPSPALKSKEMP